jgi:hypothetical protein
MGLLAVLALYGIWNWLMWVGVYKGYQPEQPIYFSQNSRWKIKSTVSYVTLVLNMVKFLRFLP